MSQILLNTISTVSPPYDIYICNVYGNSCVLVATINHSVPTPVYITLPSEFDYVPCVGVKIINSGNCESFEVVYCTPLPTPTPTPCVSTNYYYSATTEVGGGALLIYCFSDSLGTTPIDNPCELDINVDYVGHSGPVTGYNIHFSAGNNFVSDNPGDPSFTFICINSITPSDSCSCTTLNNLTFCGY